jgi:hypothetical protein
VVVGGKTAYDLAKEHMAERAKLFQEKSLPEYEQKMKKYEQIMMLLDSYVIPAGAATATAAAH